MPDKKFIRVIPCLDVKDGQVVKGVNFVNLKNAGDPVEIARAYDIAMADELCFLDISASHEGRKTILGIVEQVAGEIFIPLTVGGGISTIDDIRAVLLAGADKVAINSAAIKNPDFISRATQAFGAQCIVGALDVKKITDDKYPSGYGVFLHGGRIDAGCDALAWARELVARGVGEILLTSMDRDGTKQGFDIAITRMVSAAVDVPVIASGGGGSAADMVAAAAKGGAAAILAASIFHFGEVAIKDVKTSLAQAGFAVRL
ncbi:MAG: imidazole glycerol phosphate synthase subunit HisF [Hydrotalea sp.]|nr:imidazole glycerol phosphate synthase subunit HisF [Hydrotalea sp.]